MEDLLKLLSSQYKNSKKQGLHGFVSCEKVVMLMTVAAYRYKCRLLVDGLLLVSFQLSMTRVFGHIDMVKSNDLECLCCSHAVSIINIYPGNLCAIPCAWEFRRVPVWKYV